MTVLHRNSKMELSSRSLPGEDCLNHDGTINLLESWREILRERQVRDDAEISNNTITVSVGPQFEGNISILIILKVKRVSRKVSKCLEIRCVYIWWC